MRLGPVGLEVLFSANLFVFKSYSFFHLCDAYSSLVDPLDLCLDLSRDIWFNLILDDEHDLPHISYMC